MYKVIDLGSSFEATGEPRVRLVSNSLVKTASTEIQDFWDNIEPSDDSSYLWVIGVSSAEYYGCNNNGDAFHEADLKNCHHHFVDKANVFLHHVNRDPAKGIGKPVFSWFNDEMHRVELILRINKNAEGARDVVAKIANNEQLFVSMGCSVKFDVCSICGNQSPTRAQYCDHLRYNLKKILPDGKQVFAWNPDPQFFDISIVRKPADPTAYALDKIASDGNVRYFDMASPVVSSAELGEQVENAMAKTAAFEKLSEIYKTIDAIVADTKHKEPEVDSEELDDKLYYKGFTDAVRMLTQNGAEHIGEMSMDHDALNRADVSPVGVLKILEHEGAPLSISDAAWMAAKHFLSKNPDESLIGSLLEKLPLVLAAVRESPELVDAPLSDMLSDYHGECDSEDDLEQLSIPHREPLQVRITVVRRIAPLCKQAAETPSGYGDFNNHKDGIFSNPRTFNMLHFTLPDGRKFEVSRYELRRSGSYFNPLPNGNRKFSAGMLALAGLLGISLGSEKIRTTGAALARAGEALLSHPQKVIRSDEGVEVPVSDFMDSYKKLVKTGASLRANVVGVGAAIPALAGLDYLYNKARYGQHYADNSDDKIVQLGKTFSEHPVLTSGGSAILSDMAYNGFKQPAANAVTGIKHGITAAENLAKKSVKPVGVGLGVAGGLTGLYYLHKALKDKNAAGHSAKRKRPAAKNNKRH